MHQPFRKLAQILKLDLPKINQLRLDEGKPHLLSTLLDLQMELMAPYGELRLKERPGMTEEEEFYALTGETPTSMMAGRLVQATVIWVGRDQAKLRLDNGLVGTVSLEDVKQKPPNHMADCLKNGAEVSARVGSVDNTTFIVRLITRSDFLSNTEWWEEQYCRCVSQSVKFFSKLKYYYSGYFDPVHIYF